MVYKKNRDNIFANQHVATEGTHHGGKKLAQVSNISIGA